MKRIFALLLLTLPLFLLPTGCGATVEPPEPVYLRAAGSTSMTPLVQDLGASFGEKYPHVTLNVEGGGSSLGVELVTTGKVDFGLVSWLPDGPPEGFRAVPVARDGVAVIVHPDNPVGSLTTEQLRGIYSGRIIEWGELKGGGVGEIQPVSREDGSGTRGAFEAVVMDDAGVTRAAIVMPGSADVVDYVSAHPEAIGYVSFVYLDGRTKALDVDGYPPTPETVVGGEYPLSRDLILLVPLRAGGMVGEFLGFATGHAGQKIVGQRYGRVGQ